MKKIRMPEAMTIVIIIVALVALLSWFLPPSVFVTDDAGNSQVIYNAMFDQDGNVIKDVGPQPAGIWDVLLSLVVGFQDGSDVIINILISGAFFGILNYVGALDAGIRILINKFSGTKLIILLSLTFALLGTIYGMWEDIPVWAIVVIPLFVKAGYDVLVGIGVLFVGAIVGNMASIINPFSIGAAVGAIGNKELSVGSGIILRTVLFVVMYVIGTYFLVRYAKKVKAKKEYSYVHGIDNIKTLVEDSSTAEEAMTKEQKKSLGIFFLVIGFCVLGYIPWSSASIGGHNLYDIVNYPVVFLNSVPFLGQFLGTDAFTYLGDWYFNEAAVVFLAGTLLIGMVNRIPEKIFVEEVLKGCADLLNVALVLGMARGASVILGTKVAGMSVSLSYIMQSALAGVPVWAFVIAAVVIYIIIGIFIQSTSGVSAITMPVLGAIAFALFSGTNVGGVNGQLMLISSFTIGLNYIAVVYPCATVLGTISMANVPFDRYLKLILICVTPALIAGTLIVCIAPYIGLL